ncbi:MAG: hypothetical protein HC769_36020 [Cyanobacteria bacterium CRU_2_1]|nr:hypothetical protein [Cyanobacteria bacterium CRU_2_1]
MIFGWQPGWHPALVVWTGSIYSLFERTRATRNSVQSIIVDGNGQPWSAYEETGISYLDGDTWHSYFPLAGIPVHCLTTDATGQLWVGTDAGFYSVPNPIDEPTLVELPLPAFVPVLSPRCVAGLAKANIIALQVRMIYDIWH